MHILPVLAGLEVLVLGGGPDIFFFVHLNCASNSRLEVLMQTSTSTARARRYSDGLYGGARPWRKPNELQAANSGCGCGAAHSAACSSAGGAFLCIK